MAENKDEWQAAGWFCPNCAAEITAYQNSEGLAKAECKRCHSVSVRIKMGRRHSRIEVYASKISRKVI